ncbi:magnesium transporter [Hyperthermus butylicus]|uniref:Magnesium transporter MgtE n=1 Tax=Hyperthermus butylicus (strain DSM 5456 / JCM 9403 / PLM1-5) TaxID=415426 RepID=A2BLM1_HYPBU|nr:magnesium transporter [Hyperthermus butylicus]ABM80882.1 putative Divalent cation transporter [Hyperthermus butylicus DSM 5456]
MTLLRLVLYIEARDRPGLLAEIMGVLRELGANIITNFGYTVDDTAHLLFIIDYGGEPDELAEAVASRIREVVEARAAELGAGAAEVLAEFIRDRPGIISLLEFYVEPVDLLDAISVLPEDERRRIYGLLTPGTLASILLHGDEGVAGEVAEALPADAIARAIATLPVEDAGEVLRKLPEEARNEVLRRLPPEVRRRLAELLRYPPETAGAIMTTSVPVLRADDTVASALQQLRSGSYTIRDTVVVVDSEGRLVGLVPVDALLRAQPGDQLEKLALRPRATVSPMVNREEAARMMLRYDISRLPVVSNDGRFLGIVALEDAARILAEEAGEDIAKLAAMEKPRERYRYASPLDLVRLRLPWLILIYLMESITASIIKGYEDLIARVAVLAAFLPLIMDTSGNVGSQSSSMIIRALALGEVSERSRIDVAYIVLKELAAASTIAAILSSIGFTIAYIIGGYNVRLGLAIAATLFIVVVLADLIGSLLPILARRLGADPATLSSPLITTIMDVTVIAVYFTLASKMLGIT